MKTKQYDHDVGPIKIDLNELRDKIQIARKSVENEFIMVHEHIAVMPFEMVIEELKREECVKYLNGKELEFVLNADLKMFNTKKIL